MWTWPCCAWAPARSCDLPQSSSSSGAASKTKIQVHNLQFKRLTLAPAVAGTEAALKVDGSLTWVSSDNADINLMADRIGSGGAYDLSADLTPAAIYAHVAVKEAPDGLVAHAAGLPDIGPIDLTASVAGPRSDLGDTACPDRGKLRASEHGQVDLDRRTLTAALDATAPALTLRPDLSFQSAALNATVSGGFTDPDLTGSLQVDGLAASGATVQRVAVDATGNKGRVQARAQLDGVDGAWSPAGLVRRGPNPATAEAGRPGSAGCFHAA